VTYYGALSVKLPTAKKRRAAAEAFLLPGCIGSLKTILEQAPDSGTAAGRNADKLPLLGYNCIVTPLASLCLGRGNSSRLCISRSVGICSPRSATRVPFQDAIATNGCRSGIYDD
jgi:hypothetical protein